VPWATGLVAVGALARRRGYPGRAAESRSRRCRPVPPSRGCAVIVPHHRVKVAPPPSYTTVEVVYVQHRACTEPDYVEDSTIVDDEDVPVGVVRCPSC
jgi:hypothetical protein